MLKMNKYRSEDGRQKTVETQYEILTLPSAVFGLRSLAEYDVYRT